MRWLFSLAVFVALVCGVILFWGAEDYLSDYLTKQLGTKATVRGFGANLNSISLKGNEISSPRGSKMARAFSVGAIQIEAPWSSYFKKTIHLDTIKIDSPTVGIELCNSSGSSNNWAPILASMPRCAQGRPLKVDRLVLTNIQFDVQKSNGKSVEVAPIAYLEIKDLGTVSGTELSRIILHSILEMATKETALSKILNDVMPLSKSLMPEKTNKAEKIEPVSEDLSFKNKVLKLSKDMF